MLRIITTSDQAKELDKAVDLLEQKHFDDEFLGMYIEISIKCNNLPNYDTVSLTDAACILFMQDKSYDDLQCLILYRGRWKRVGQTEIITDSLNPKFVKSNTLHYMFEEKQRVLTHLNS